jgi:hypothetical protein
MNTHMKKLSIIANAWLVLSFTVAQAQPCIPTNFKMINAKMDDHGELIIVPSKTSSEHDFDFLAGNWTMENKRLKARLAGSTEWIEYPSTSENRGTILQGIGNMDFYRSSFNTVGGKSYEGLTLRLFNPKTKLWSLYWVDSNLGTMDPPVVGSFEGSIGTFYCKDVFKGKPILVMFKWDKTDPENPVWCQAFSPDNGATWEYNMGNVSHRVK